MKKNRSNKNSLEVLESRIAPANVPLTAEWLQASHSATGSPIALHAGQGLSSGGANSGDYLLYVAKGNAWIFTTDFNNNNLVDYNEITGIAAGDGLRLISFVDIRGDIVTNLKETPTSAGVLLSLTDSNNNSADDNPALRGDGRVVLNNRIEAIELRTLTVNDIGDQNGDQVVDETDVDLRRAPSTHSIFGNIYAGGGFGVPGDPTSGLLIDSTVITNFGFETVADVKPQIGDIRVGTAVSGEYFSFGVKGGFDASGGNLTQRIRAGVVIGDDAQGYILPFVPSPGQAGASIAYVRSASNTMPYNLNGLFAGSGGPNAPGGSIMDVSINGDDAGGYEIVAGNGGSGTRGGQGGSIIRFSDINSDTSEVIIRSGSGGNGTTGAGGNAGSSEILNANFYGNYSLILGDGGDGFTSGGSGASLTRAFIEQVETVGATAGTGWGTTHNGNYYNPDPSQAQPFEANLGTTEAIDINGDGVGDFVYSSNGVSQIVVLFGDPNFPGFFLPERIYLDSPRNAEAITVADLNGDGRTDIAAASSDLGNQSGIAVYLSKWNDFNRDGDVLDAEDQFLGFHSPRYSALPQLETGDSTTTNAVLPFWQGPGQVTRLVAGDFDGDGANELAASVTYYAFKTETNGITTSLTNDFQTVVFLTPDRELDTNTGQWFLTGQFYADFGTRRVTTAAQDAPAAPLLPFVSYDIRIGRMLMEATSLTTMSTHDVVVVSEIGDDDVFVADNFTPSALGPLALAGGDLGRVDTDRRNGEVAPTDMTARDFALMDFDNDGDIDAVFVSDGPANFIVGMEGDGAGGFTQNSNDGGDQAGYFSNTLQFRGVKAADADNDGTISDFALMYQDGPDTVVAIYNFRPGPSTPLAGPQPGPIISADLYIPSRSVLPYHSGNVTDTVFFDMYYADPGNRTTAAAQAGLASDTPNRWIIFDPIGISIEQLALPQINVIAGDGGDSFVGRGGNGGFLGGKGRLETTIIDPNNNISFTDYTGAIEIVFEGGTVTLEGGDGGLGFSRGGNGGSVTGVTLRDPDPTNRIIPIAEITAGNGGRGVSGTGGAGGDLVANSIFNGAFFTAGDGGAGKFGGRGGSVIGNGLKVGTTRIYDTFTQVLDVAAGDGGNGTRGGGAGGSVVNFRPIIDGIIGGGGLGAGGAMRYVAGNGGSAVSGTGGAGGSVTNSSPELNVVLEDEIFIEAGRGGDGRSGGNGGNISTFAVTLSSPQVTRVVGLIAGHGGNGFSGPGGKGGSITAISALSGGTSEQVIFNSPNGGAFFTYSRFLAGDGGNSAGSRGGDGGTISNVLTGASQGSIAIVGGAGGQGLTQGGTGGSVLNVELAALGAGSNSKALVIAGAGGDARSFIVNPNDTTPNQSKKAFGGKIGIGGNGGNINGFRQGGDVGGHFDFIAGNGGSTLFYGAPRDPKPFVGRGGSVLNVNIKGTAGNMDLSAPILSYNDVDMNETMQNFVESRLRIGEALFETLGDGDGNVGIVVGASGRNKAVAENPNEAPYDYISQPANGAKNGDLINFRGAGIMAAVAGSVDRLASIQLAKGIVVEATFVGTDKGQLDVFEYINEFGEIDVDPVRDGRLLDGAFIAQQIVQLPGQPALVGRIFSL